eukprot:642852-Pyramimonas_sp.AAC.1
MISAQARIKLFQSGMQHMRWAPRAVSSLRRRRRTSFGMRPPGSSARTPSRSSVYLVENGDPYELGTLKETGSLRANGSTNDIDIDIESTRSRTASRTASRRSMLSRSLLCRYHAPPSPPLAFGAVWATALADRAATFARAATLSRSWAPPCSTRRTATCLARAIA